MKRNTVKAETVVFDTATHPTPPNTEPRYRLPICDLTLKRSQIFPPTDLVLMRPEDVERNYGIPVKTVRDLYTNADRTKFPHFRIGRCVFIPRIPLQDWIIANSTLVPVEADKSTPSQCPSLAVPFTPSNERQN